LDAIVKAVRIDPAAARPHRYRPFFFAYRYPAC
jgi:hypothetical protein